MYKAPYFCVSTLSCACIRYLGCWGRFRAVQSAHPTKPVAHIPFALHSHA